MPWGRFFQVLGRVTCATGLGQACGRGETQAYTSYRPNPIGMASEGSYSGVGDSWRLSGFLLTSKLAQELILSHAAAKHFNGSAGNQLQVTGGSKSVASQKVASSKRSADSAGKASLMACPTSRGLFLS